MRSTRAAVGMTLAALAALLPARARPEAISHWCGTHPAGRAASLAAHREHAARRPALRSASATASRDFDAEGVAVLVDAGDLIQERSFFDLTASGLRLTPEEGAFRLSRVDAAPLPDTGESLGLGDDDTREIALPFAFPFFGSEYRSVFVNSDGNLTFGRGDDASTPRNLGRLLSGPPRVAVLLADFDPERGGRITASATSEALVVSWSEVPQFDRFGSNDFQVVLRPDGSIELNWSQVTGLIQEGVVGVAPGAPAADFTPLDLSEVSALSVPGAFAESFRDAARLDLVAAARRFYATHPDDFDQLLVFSTRRLVESGTFAFQRNVGNAVSGIGIGLSDESGQFGSAGRLQSVAMMDDLAKYPDDPFERFLDEDNALGVLAHEVGHRWLARVQFRDGETDSFDLLGRQLAHWSFFTDSDGSHVEGNDIQDLGGGVFETVGAGLRYGPMDLYLMGLLGPEAVPPLFVVRDAEGDGALDREGSPRTGVSFTGERVDVRIDAVIAAEGPRTPAAGPPAGPWRQAFLLVVPPPVPEDADLQKLQRMREAWEPFFAASTGGLWAADTRLR